MIAHAGWFHGNKRQRGGLIPGKPKHEWNDLMKDFADAAFVPEQIEAMGEALEGAVATLPEPVSAHRVQDIAESILRSAKQGERDPRTLQTMALVEMQIRSDG
jgi:hypothetical protein